MRRFTALGATIMALLLAGCASGPGGGLEEGGDLMAANDYAAARDHYESMLAEYPNDPYVHLNLGVAYQQLGQADRAREHYEAAIAHGGEAEVTRLIGPADAAARGGTVAELARQNLEANANPPGLNADLERGWRLMVEENYAAARDHYQRMLIRYPDNPYAHLNLGVAHQRLGNDELARVHHEAAIAHGSNAYTSRVPGTADGRSRSGVQWWKEMEASGVTEQAAANPDTTTVAELAQENLRRLRN